MAILWRVVSLLKLSFGAPARLVSFYFILNFHMFMTYNHIFWKALLAIPVTGIVVVSIGEKTKV